MSPYQHTNVANTDGKKKVYKTTIRYTIGYFFVIAVHTITITPSLNQFRQGRSQAREARL